MLTLRAKAIFFMIPVIVVISAVHTLDAIRTERAILRAEILKRGETVAAIAARSAELAVLSRNPELLKRAAWPLTSTPDVSSVALYDAAGDPLLREGSQRPQPLPPNLSPSRRMTFRETPQTLEFIAPVFTVKAGAEIDLFQEATSEQPASEHIGWALIGISQQVHRRAEAALIRNGVLLGVLFCAVGVVLVYVLIKIVTKPLHALIDAVKGLREGEYIGIAAAPSRDEVGTLSREWRRMSTAIQEREDRILASETRLRSLFERVEHAIFRLDANGTIVEHNRKFEELFPCPTTFDALFALGAGDRLARALEGDLRQAEERVLGRDGAERTVMMSVYPDHDETGAQRGFDGYLVDVTEQKRLEEALVQTQKLESLGLLAGGIAHDFNNILAGILGYAEVLQIDCGDSAAVIDHAKVIEQSALRAAALTQQLLGFARKGKFKVEPVDVNQVAGELVHFLRETFDRTIAVVLSTDKDLPAVLGDGTQVYQALMNLCINARDAMPEGGRLSVKTEFCDLAAEEAHEHFSIPPGPYVQISVTDTGTGMAPDVKRRIFEPFYTTKDVGKGTGLGLSMAYGIAKNHGGYINVDSDVGLGTTMRVYLPAMRGAAGVQAPAERPGGAHGTATILVIDDEKVVRDVAREVLESHSYRVLSATNGAEGVRLFAERRDAIDLVVLDMVMPEKGGAQAFKEIRAMVPTVKVLLCSGYDEEAYFRELFELGASGFVQKPFRFSELLRQVERALGAK